MKDTVRSLAEKWNVNGNFCAMSGGRTLFSIAHGFVNEEQQLPYTEKSRTYVASVTKQFTAVCIMMLYEQGKLDIDDTLDRYIPEYYLAPKVTLRQLLNMTSGIPNQLSVIGDRLRNRRGGFDMTDGEFERMVCREIAPEKCSVQDFMEIANSEPMIFEPGEKFDYSDTNYTFLGEIVSRVSGVPYAEFMEKHIFGPVGMENTVVGAIYSDGPSYRTFDGVQYNMGKAYFTTGEGSICTSAGELCLWLNAVLEGRFISRKSWDECFRPVNGYGFGWHGKDGWFLHGGGDLGYSSMVWIHPASRTAIAGAMNKDGAGFYGEMYEAVRRELNI